MISRAKNATKASGKAKSNPAVRAGGSRAEVPTAIRPTTHKPVSPANAAPTTGSWPVQFGTAVSRNPAMIAPR